MPFESDVSLQRVYQQLSSVSTTLAQQYKDVAPVMGELCSAAELHTWSEHCLRLAHGGWRTWTSAEAFVQHSPWLLRQSGPTALWQWAEQGYMLAGHSPEGAVAFFRAARVLLQEGTTTVFSSWVAAGQWYLAQRPALPALAVEYFTVSPGMYAQYPLSTVTRWQQLAQTCSNIGIQYGRQFFGLTRQHLERSLDVDYTPAWESMPSLLPHAVEVALAYGERYADLVHRLGSASAARVGAVLQELSQPIVSEASAFLRLIGSTLGFLSVPERLQVLEWCQQIATKSHPGVLAFLQHLPALWRILPGPQLSPWITTGIATARTNTEAGHAYFALESVSAHECLRQLQKRAVFAHMEAVLQLYTEAMLGRSVALRSTADLPSGLHLAGRDLPMSDGSTIYVPPEVDDFADAHTNFAVYKVAILHQVGFYEAGTFTFQVEEWGRQGPALHQRLAALAAQPRPGLSTAFEHFFALFPQAELARRLFAILEDTRIDAYLMRQYKGIRHDLTRLSQHSLQQRPALAGLPLLSALLEGILQLSLGARFAASSLPASVSPIVYALLQRLARQLLPLHAAGATVYDTANAVWHCYQLLSMISATASSHFPEEVETELAALLSQLPDDAESMRVTDLFRLAGEGAESMPILPESPEPAVSIAPVPYRGDVKPELIQKKMRLHELAEALQSRHNLANPLPPEVLHHLLEQGNVTLKSLELGELTATSGLFLTDIEGREGLPAVPQTEAAAVQDELAVLHTELQTALAPEVARKARFFYDEWDHLIQDYRRHWCQLEETVLDDAGTTFVDDTRQRYTELLTQVSRQLQLLKPEMLHTIKGLVDGEDIDLDSAIEALVDQRASNTPPEKVYMRRYKRDRSVAAAFLLDMSASTDDDIKAPDATTLQSVPAPLRQYDFSGFVQDDYARSLASPPAPPASSRCRIIDVEKEALVLMAEALQGLGDAYAIYGFSGYGREQVDFFVVKEFAEPYDRHIQGRIGAVKPHRSTRMGAAIRHTVRKLQRQDARIKTLLLLSDGYPQDYDYGKDRNSKDYGLQDTMMALHEARLKGIQTFCMTVDPAGHDYLRAMCPDQRYLVLADITALPHELPKVYRGLTT